MNDKVDDDWQEQDLPEQAPAPASSPPDQSTEAKRLITLAVPPIDRVLVLLGAAAMVLAGLLSWVEVAPDPFPNFAGIGAGGGGVGLAVFVIGLALLSNRLSIDTENGVALGAMLASLIAVIALVGESEELEMGAGAWVATLGSLLALIGVTLGTMDPSRRPTRRVTNKLAVAFGAGMAITASFWMDWSAGYTSEMQSALSIPRGLRADVATAAWRPLESSDSFPLPGGLDADVLTGYPVLILSVVVLLLVVGLLSPTISVEVLDKMAMNIRVASIAVTVLAAGDIAGSLMSGGLVGSGPILALVSAAIIVRLVDSPTGAAADSASARLEAR